MPLSFLKKLFGAEETEPETQPKAQKKPTPQQTAAPQADVQVDESDANPVHFVEFTVKNLVANPDAVTLSVDEKDSAIEITVECDKSDIGRVIGKRGRTINAIRALANDAAGRKGQNVAVELVD